MANYTARIGAEKYTLQCDDKLEDRWIEYLVRDFGDQMVALAQNNTQQWKSTYDRRTFTLVRVSPLTFKIEFYTV